MTSSLRSIQPLNDQVIVALHDGSGYAVLMGKQNDSPLPIHTLEAAIVGSIGFNLLSSAREKGIESALSSLSYSVSIRDAIIKVECICEPVLESAFIEAVNRCEISTLTPFNSEIEFIEKKQLKKQK